MNRLQFLITGPGHFFFQDLSLGLLSKVISTWLLSPLSLLQVSSDTLGLLGRDENDRWTTISSKRVFPKKAIELDS